MGHRAGLDGCGKSAPTGIRSPNRPDRSESLYRLSYPDGVRKKTGLTACVIKLDDSCLPPLFLEELESSCKGRTLQ